MAMFSTFSSKCWMTDGLTDGQGRTVDFKNTLIIMTSNVGSEYLVNERDDSDLKDARGLVMAELRLKFRPEFLNRLDDVIVFHKLKRDQMAAIVDIQIGRLQKLLADRKITLHLDEQARAWLAGKGYDPAYGARPLKRVIQRSLQDQLAERILAGDVSDGQRIEVTVDGDELVIGAANSAAA